MRRALVFQIAIFLGAAATSAPSFAIADHEQPYRLNEAIVRRVNFVEHLSDVRQNDQLRQELIDFRPTASAEAAIGSTEGPVQHELAQILSVCALLIFGAVRKSASL